MDYITLIVNNGFFLLGYSLLFLIIGYFLPYFFKSGSSEKASEIIEDYVDEIVSEKEDKIKEYEPIIKPKFRPKRMEEHNTPPKVLIAEDNLVNAKILIKTLAKFGIEDYVHVENGELAVEERKNLDNNFDIVLMDINMPKMTGDEATQVINKWEEENNIKHIPIIAVTANAINGDREKYLNAGMDDYTTKPLKKQSLAEIITKFTGFKIEV